MTHRVTSDQVWQEIEKSNFGVLGMVTSNGESRTVGIVYVVDDRKLYIGAQPSAWKSKHIARESPCLDDSCHPSTRPADAVDQGTGHDDHVLGHRKAPEEDEIEPRLFEKMYRHEEGRDDWCAIEVTPEKDFITYGVGISVLQMRFPEKSRARAPVAAS